MQKSSRAPVLAKILQTARTTDMTDKGLLTVSCEAALEFPRNLVRHDSYEYILNSYHSRLDEHEKRLFQDESKSTLDFSELDHDGNCQSSTNLIFE